MRSLTERPSASDITVTFSRFGRNRRLVLRFEWLTLCPTCADLPVNSHRHDMANSSRSGAAHGAPQRHFGLKMGWRTYSGGGRQRQATLGRAFLGPVGRPVPPNCPERAKLP